MSPADDNGQPISASVAALKAVERARQAQADAIAAGRLAPPEPDDPTDEPWRLAWNVTVPRRYRDAVLADLPPTVASPLVEWAHTPEPDALNVLLGGEVGTGKTHTAVATAREWAETHRRSPRFWPLVELLDALRPGGDEGAMVRAIESPLLIIDDLGTERLTDWAAERLYLLVNRRWLDERPTIGTTNLTGDELRAAVGDRISSRLLGGAVTLRLTGDDRRRQKRATLPPSNV